MSFHGLLCLCLFCRYILNGTTTSSCMHDGKWSHPPPVCECKFLSILLKWIIILKKNSRPAFWNILFSKHRWSSTTLVRDPSQGYYHYVYSMLTASSFLTSCYMWPAPNPQLWPNHFWQNASWKHCSIWIRRSIRVQSPTRNVWRWESLLPSQW